MMDTATAKHPKTNQKLSLTFFFPYRDISGVPVLFLRMAEFLSMHYGIETCVIDYSDGYMARTIRERNSPVPVRFFDDGVPMNIDSDTVLVLQSILPYTMRPELKINSDTRVVFWTLYHLNLVQTIIPLPFFRHIQSRYILFHQLFMNTLMLSLKGKLQTLITSMNNKRSIFFMDGSTLKYTQERLNVQIDSPIYMPVPCDDVPQNLKKAKASSGDDSPLTFCWVGRIADFKTHILIYTIQKLSELARKKSLVIQFHVIGEGPDELRLRSLNVVHDCFQLISEGIISGVALNNFLLDRVDILAAMGTSALEGAKLGVPTVLLDASYGAVKGDYRFRWLFESKDYGLADLMDDSQFVAGNDSLERIIEEARRNYAALSDRTFEYCAQNHSISSVCGKFRTAIAGASFHYGDFSPEIMKKYWIRRAYERVRENKKGV